MRRRTTMFGLATTFALVTALAPTAYAAQDDVGASAATTTDVVASTTDAAIRSDQDWNPPSHLVNPLNEVWNHVESTYPDLYGFRNYGWDQLIANNGQINYCVRWDSAAPVSAQLRDEIHVALQRQVSKWMDVFQPGNWAGRTTTSR